VKQLHFGNPYVKFLARRTSACAGQFEIALGDVETVIIDDGDDDGESIAPLRSVGLLRSLSYYRAQNGHINRRVLK